jgi:hypothetical protein
MFFIIVDDRKGQGTIRRRKDPPTQQMLNRINTGSFNIFRVRPKLQRAGLFNSDGTFHDGNYYAPLKEAFFPNWTGPRGEYTTQIQSADDGVITADLTSEQ